MAAIATEQMLTSSARFSQKSVCSDFAQPSVRLDAACAAALPKKEDKEEKALLVELAAVRLVCSRLICSRFCHKIYFCGRRLQNFIPDFVYGASVYDGVCLTKD